MRNNLLFSHDESILKMKAFFCNASLCSYGVHLNRKHILSPVCFVSELRKRNVVLQKLRFFLKIFFMSPPVVVCLRSLSQEVVPLSAPRVSAERLSRWLLLCQSQPASPVPAGATSVSSGHVTSNRGGAAPCVRFVGLLPRNSSQSVSPPQPHFRD